MGKRDIIVLRTDLSLEECQRRLQNETDTAKLTIFSFSGYKGSRPVLSKLKGSKFRIWKRRYYRNSFAPLFFGTLDQDGRGTLVEGRFDMDPFVKGFMIFWLASVVLSGVTLLISAVSRHSKDALMGALIPSGMFLFGLLLPRIGKLMARSEERFLRDFLESTLAARPNPPSNPSVFDNRPFG